MPPNMCLFLAEQRLFATYLERLCIQMDTVSVQTHTFHTLISVCGYRFQEVLEVYCNVSTEVFQDDDLL